jgi:hypothetical protein
LSSFVLGRAFKAAFLYTEAMANRDPFLLDRTAFSIGQLHDPSDEKAHWLARSPLERLEAIEVMRQILYGYNPASSRLQRVLTVAQLERG